jgi:uncharacterized protein YceK
MRFGIFMALGALAMLAGGCGTMAALGRDEMWPNQVYAGTRAAAGGHVTQFDVPFSLVADTLVLPYTIPRSIHNQKHPPATRPAETKAASENERGISAPGGREPDVP